MHIHEALNFKMAARDSNWNSNCRNYFQDFKRNINDFVSKHLKKLANDLL